MATIRSARSLGVPSTCMERPVLEAIGERMAYWILDRETGQVGGSRRFRELIGEDLGTADLRSLLDWAHPEDRDRLSRAIEAGRPFDGDYRFRDDGGGSTSLGVSGRVVVDGLSLPRFLVLTFEAGDEARPTGPQPGAEVRGVEEDRVMVDLTADDFRSFYHSLVESVPYAIFRKDTQGRYTFGNRRYREMHGLDLAGLIGKTDFDLYPPELARKYREDDRRAFERAEIVDLEEHHCDPRCPQRSQVVHTIKSPVYDSTGRAVGIQGMFSDVTERRRVAEQLAHQATHDSLTGLPNRDLFQQKLQAHLGELAQNSGRLAVLLVDLDRFKEINDTFGHHYGDRILQQLGPRFESVLEGGETVARLGGDEFGVLLPDAGRERASVVAERLLAAIAVPMRVGGHRLDIGASIGVALCPDHGSSRIGLVQHADVAMYAAKRGRGGHAFYASEQSSYSPERLSLLVDLRQAQANQQFLLHYQPKIDVATRRPRGAEALIRWRHPIEGMIAPGRFIPLAEQVGLIRSIDLWAAAAASADCRGWPGEGGPLSVAVNLSAAGLQDPDLVDQFARIVEGSGLAPSRLIVEVTESAMMADPAAARLGLAGLHEMGLAIAIDDFGTGYSSLAYLKDLPIDEVKIDQSFIRHLARGGPDACIVRAVVDLGHNLGLKVTAEGVEDAETLGILDGLGCDLAQGYHISPPLPLPSFLEWLRSQAKPA